MNNDKRRKIERNAHKLMSKHAYSKAIKEYKILSEAFPDDLNYLKDLAQCYKGNSDNIKALECYKKLTEGYRKKSLFKQSVAIYKIMISIGDESLEVYEQLAEAYTILNMKNDAAIVYRKPLENFMLKKEYSKAIAVANKILEFNENDTIALINLAEAKFAFGEKEEAVSYFKKAAALYKKQNNLNMYVKILGRINHVTEEGDPETLIELAMLYISQKSYGPELLEILLKSYRVSKAKKENEYLIETTKLLVTFFKETNQRKQMLSIRYELAKLYEDMGSLDKALEVYNKILQIAPGSYEVKKKAQELSEKINKAKGVIPVAKQNISIPNPRKEKAQIKNAMREIDTFIKFRLYDKAINVVNGLHLRYPHNQLVLKKAKEVYISSSDMENAIKTMFELFEVTFKRDKEEARGYLEEVIYYDHNNKKANKFLAHYFGVKNSSEYIEDIDSLIEEDSLDGDSLIEDVEMIDEGDSLINSIDVEEISIDVIPKIDDKKERVNKIEFYMNQGLYNNAKKELDILLKDNPRESTYLRLLSKLELLMAPTIDDSESDIDKVVEMFKMGVDKNVPKSDTKTRYDLAIAYKEMGLIDTAIDEFKLLLKTTDRKSDTLLMLGLCFNDKMDYSSAIKHFKKALEYTTEMQQKISIYYEIANSYELKGNLEHAFKVFKKIIKRDKGFRDSVQRIKGLQRKIKNSSSSSSHEISYL